jgi:hypothetical protein
MCQVITSAPALASRLHESHRNADFWGESNGIDDVHVHCSFYLNFMHAKAGH